MRATTHLLTALALFASLDTQATVLTFDTGSTGVGGADYIPADYGDRVTSVSQGLFSYGMGDGFTPNIVVDYFPEAPFDDFTLWGSNYGELVRALGHINFNVPGKIVFVPDSGFTVRLNSFRVAGWAGVEYTSDFRIWDDNGSFDSPNLFFSLVDVPGSASIQPLSAPLVGVGAIHLYSDVWGSIGLDDVNFSQTLVPLPAGLPLLLSGLGLGWLVRRRQRK